MNQLYKTLLAGVAGTTVMTADSELMSWMFGENFREPQHLATMVKRLAPRLSKHANQVAGWGAHYAMGLVFAAVYVELWEKKKIPHTLLNGLLLGAISGALGFLIWKSTFKSHPFPPVINYDHYYLQRIPAHIVFAITATLTYRLTLKHQATQRPMDNFPITITKDKEVHYFEIGEYPHHDESKCRYRAFENGELVATFEPDAQNLLHICQNPSGIDEEILYMLADQIEISLQHPGDKHLKETDNNTL
jgi:hypothetical protein